MLGTRFTTQPCHKLWTTKVASPVSLWTIAKPLQIRHKHFVITCLVLKITPICFVIEAVFEFGCSFVKEARIV